MFSPQRTRLSCRAVTLLELVTVLLVIAILIVILLPVYAQFQRRAQKTACLNNLRSLHVAADLYLQEHHAWPQIKTSGVEPNDLATSWIDALAPYGLAQINWVCPTIQQMLQNPDLTNHDNARIDYMATPFDSNPQTPFRWSMQPWFVESGDVHGNGNLILFPDGHIQELGDFKSMIQRGSHPRIHALKDREAQTRTERLRFTQVVARLISRVGLASRPPRRASCPVFFRARVEGAVRLQPIVRGGTGLELRAGAPPCPGVRTLRHSSRTRRAGPTYASGAASRTASGRSCSNAAVSVVTTASADSRSRRRARRSSSTSASQRPTTIWRCGRRERSSLQR